MIEPAALLAWTALALAVTLAPGPDTMLVASHAARGGLRAGLAAVAGIASGVFFYTALFGLGLLQVLAASPVLFATVKIAGACYLAFIGAQMLWKALRAEQKALAQSSPAQVQLAHPYRQALLTNVLNPKIAVFYLAVLPQFTGAGPAAPGIGVLLIAIHYVLGAVWLSVVALAASHAWRAALNTTFVRWLEGAVGVFFVGLAGRIALERN